MEKYCLVDILPKEDEEEDVRIVMIDRNLTKCVWRDRNQRNWVAINDSKCISIG